MSAELLQKIDKQKDVYLRALPALTEEFNALSRFNLDSPKVLALDRAAFLMRDTAYALRSNERSVLSTIQQRVASMQELMARRLSLSEEVNDILINVSEARQVDRDFLLSQTDEARRVHSATVLALLEDVISRARKIQTLLIEEDEKAAFKNVVPSISLYRDKFSLTVDVALKASTTGREMVEAALKADDLLNTAQETRLHDIADARSWAEVLGPVGIFFGLGIVLLAVLMRQAQKKLSTAYGVISSSIDYASHIQRSILPDDDLFNASFKQHFIIWEPRDRVGGDIYWHHSWQNGTLVVLADCTGHGVPGAFMSLIANSALEAALDEVEPGEVGELIQRMHQRIQLTLRQHQDSGESDDGLELGAIYVPAEEGRLVFAGARFSVFVVRHAEGKEVVEVKGNKSGIGYRGVSLSQQFDNHSINYLPGDAFYMASDGLVDQVGGEKRLSFGKRRFKELLLSVSDLHMSRQRSTIYQSFAKYQGGEPRRDDLSVIGFKL